MTSRGIPLRRLQPFRGLRRKLPHMRTDETQQLGALSFAALMDALPDEVVLLDAQGWILAANDPWRRFSIDNGGKEDAYLGTNYFDVCRVAEGSSSTEAQIVPRGLDVTLRTGEPFTCEYPCDSPTVKRWFEMSATRLIHDGAPYLLVQHRNITTRYVGKQTVEEAFISNSAMAALVTGTSDAIISYDLDGRISTWNPAAEKLYGYTAKEAIGRPLDMLYPPDWPHPVTYYRDEIIAGRLERFEATRLAKDGTARDVWISCAPIRSSSGEVVAVSNIHRDVTEIRKMEKARELIAREVIHRAKNMLTIVSAIRRQTARKSTSFEDFQEKFDARIRALAKSTDLLSKGSWTTVTLQELAVGHLDPFIAAGDPRLRISGPPVGLEPQAVQTIGMAIHELATNSAKYGALVHDAGRIDLVWNISVQGTSPVLDLTWSEKGLAQRSANRNAGFGSTVLTSIAPSMLNTESSHDIRDDEVRWSITVSAEHFSLSA